VRNALFSELDFSKGPFTKPQGRTSVKLCKCTQQQIWAVTVDCCGTLKEHETARTGCGTAPNFCALDTNGISFKDGFSCDGEVGDLLRIQLLCKANLSAIQSVRRQKE